MKESAISVKSEQISHKLTMNTNYFDANQPMNDANKSFDLVHNESNANITTLNITKNVNAPILQEITTAVVNGSNIVNKITNDFEKFKEHENRPPKTNEHCDNDMNCQKRKCDVKKARKFIQMQREKWKEAERSEKVKSKPATTRDEIKERLNALRKSTLSIVAKNVKKARNDSAQRTNSKNITVRKSNTPPKRPIITSERSIGKFEIFEEPNVMNSRVKLQLSDFLKRQNGI